MSKDTRDRKWRETLGQLADEDFENQNQTQNPDSRFNFDSTEESDSNLVNEGPITLRESLITHSLLGRGFKDPNEGYSIFFTEEGDIRISRNGKIITIISGDSFAEDEDEDEDEDVYDTKEIE